MSIPSHEDTKPDRGVLQDAASTVASKCLAISTYNPIFGFASTEDDKIDSVASDDAETSRSQTNKAILVLSEIFIKVWWFVAYAMNKPMPAPTASTSDWGIILASH